MPEKLFEGFTDQMSTLTPLSPSEVRRRGDRRRRRTQVAVGLAGVAAAAAIITPVALASGGSQPARNDAPIASDGPSTPAPAVTTIAGGFPLEAGMGGESGIPATSVPYGPNVTDGLTSLHVCSGPASDLVTWEASQATSVRLASWSDGVEGGEFRALAVYPEAKAPREAIAFTATSIRGCPASATMRSVQLATPAAGDEALAYVDQHVDEDGLLDGSGDLVVMVRVGNALLLSRTYVMSAGDLAMLDQQVADWVADAAGTIEAMESTYGG